MHADIRQLIAMRDREPVAAAIAMHVTRCSQCQLRMQALHGMRDALRELPEESPPDGAWENIVALRAMETGARGSGVRRVAAVVAIAVAGLLALFAGGFAMRQLVTVQPGRMETQNLAALQHHSRELEYLLRRYEPATMMSLRTAGAIGELEDSIALIDYQLAAPDGDARRRRELWRQRVELMETLVTVRATERYADSI